MAGLEINVATDGSVTEESSNKPTIIVANHSSIAPTDYSNTIVVQNASNASVVSIFPLVGNVPQATQTTEMAVPETTTVVPTFTGGTGY